MEQLIKTKLCRKCDTEKPHDDFYIRKETGKPVAHCKSCISEYAKQNIDRRREIQKKSDLKRVDKAAIYKEQYYLENKEHIDKRNKLWQSNNADRVRSNYYQKKYNITLQQYNEILEKQNHSCAICERHESEFKKRLAVDHDHKTLEIFGLLCDFCNRRFIGRNRKPELYVRAAKYLSKGTGFFTPKKKPSRRYRKYTRK